MTLKPPQTINDLLTSYKKLSKFDKTVLLLCCIVYEPVDVNTLSACLLAYYAKDPKAKKQTNANLELTLHKLKEFNFLKIDNQCVSSFVEIPCRSAIKNQTFEPISRIVQHQLPTSETYLAQNAPEAYERIIRDLRIAIYTNDLDAFNSVLLSYFNSPGLEAKPNPVIAICNNPFEPGWFATLQLQIQLYALNQTFKDALFNLKPPRNLVPFLEKQANKYKLPPEAKKSFVYLLTTQLILAGNLTKAKEILTKHRKTTVSLGLRGSLSLLMNENDDAIKHFESDLTILRQLNDNPNAYFTGFEGLLYMVSMLKTGDFGYLETIKKIFNSIETFQPHNLFKDAYISLRFVIEALENRIDLKIFQQHVKRLRHANSISILFGALAAYWITGNPSKELINLLSPLYEASNENGYKWLAVEFGKLLELINADRKTIKTVSQTQMKTGIFPLTSAVTFEEPWQRALKALLHSSSPEYDDIHAEHKIRLSWHVNYDDESGALNLVPKEQRCQAKRKWTKGRAVSLKKLHAGDFAPYMTTQDKKICEGIGSKENKWGISYYFDLEAVLPEIIGHPHLFREDSPLEPVEFIKGYPELRVKEQNGIFQLRFYPEITKNPIVLIKETPTRFKVYEISGEHRRVAYIIGEKGINVPAEAKEEVLAVLGNVSSFMMVHSDIEGETDLSTAISADPKIYVHLIPYAQGLRISMYVKPFRTNPPYLKPGKGASNVITEIDGRRVQIMRNLEQEEDNLLLVEDNCPSLALFDRIDNEWIIQDPEDCLEVLLDLQGLGNTITIEWPEGEKFTVSRQITTDKFYVNIRKKNDWFQIDGELDIDDGLVLDMYKLLELSQTTSGRFIPIGEGQFLTLTKELRKRIDELYAYSDQRGKNVRLNPLTALSLEDFSHSGIHIDADINWREQIKKIREAQEFQPTIPTTLRADLRDYQIEGFTWLARMAYWGVGACLADDMGLGKTIQTLAIIVDRAPKGPTLVVAPTSVCLNWQKEANRFAPTLNIKLFTGKQRNKLINNLGEFDVLVVSYALLQQESERLGNINWKTVVLDEAQAIKNMATKRSKAAMTLKADFKIITTGTPIENHLGELWNLFNFINPGLLGSYRQFINRFINPIERNQDRNSKQKLKKLIRPFILRRIKSQVLEELPPRTEITLQVEMDKNEAALYEALRQQALEKININNSPGAKHLTILAQITRLRRVCCNPQLVIPDTNIQSSKLALFKEIIEELLENRHKALVFSQFVDHLHILRNHLDEQGITYMYIDGSTPAKQRQKAVESFQAGKGDLFLISLKAGGLGLNLTAADYVIHMDPWWNPAVEDQASDRAHRIGQQHPVTVYRLVTQNTIEEKIISLHQEKRDLADSLLEGADISDKITAEELLRLLQDN